MSLKIYSSSIAIPPGYTLGNDIQMFSRNQSIFFISGAPPSVKKNAGNLIDIKDIQPTASSPTQREEEEKQQKCISKFLNRKEPRNTSCHLPITFPTNLTSPSLVPLSNSSSTLPLGLHEIVQSCKNMQPTIAAYDLRPQKIILGHPKRTQSHKNQKRIRVLDPLSTFEKQQKKFINEEQNIANIIQNKIDQLGAEIPVNFLLERKHRDFVLRIAAATICKIIKLSHLRSMKFIFHHWQKRMEISRILEQHELKIQRKRMEYLYIALNIVYRKHFGRNSVILNRWRSVTHKLKMIECNAKAIIIQRLWRRKFLRIRLQQLSLEYRYLITQRACVLLQIQVRRFLAFRRFQRLVKKDKQTKAANKIQKHFRKYRIYSMSKRKTQNDQSSIVIQRNFRGFLGRKKVFNRRVIIHEIACNFLWHAILPAEERVILKHKSSYILQRLFITNLVQRKITRHLEKLFKRKRFLPILRIQRSWYKYRASLIEKCLASMISQIVTCLHTAAIQIQCVFKGHNTRRKQQAALQLTSFFKKIHAKKIMRDRLSIWFQEFFKHSVVFQHFQVTPYYQSQSSLTPLISQLHQLLQQVDEYQRLQLSPYNRLRAHDGLKLMQLVQQISHDILEKCARKIQISWRARTFLSFVHAEAHARRVLRKNLLALFHAYRMRKKRHRVLHSWKRRRFVVLHYCFRTWKDAHMIIQERNILSQAKEKSSRARWHYHKSLQRKLFTLFFTHVLQQRVVHAKWKKTIAHHKFAQCRRYFVSWYKATYTTISEKKIDEMKSILHYFNRLQVHRLVQIQKHKAEVHLLVRLRRKAWVELKQLRSEGKHNASIAQAHYDEVLIEKAWQAFKQRVLLLKNADNLHRYHSQKKIIHQWIERKAYSFYDKKVTALGATFRRKKLLKQQFGVWHLRAQWKIQERRLFALAKENYLRHCFKHAIALWDRRKNVLLDLKLINQIATDFRYFKLIQLGYEEAFFLQWSITVGKKRIAMAIRIQKVYRGNRGRKKARQKRMLVQYQMERRIGSEADAKDISVEQLFRSFKTQVWSFSFLYFPWEPADKFQRKCFAKLATAFSMRSKTVHFGFLDVTQVAKTSFGRGLSGASQTSVLSQFSLVPEQVCSVIAFWQGRGHLTMPSKSKYRRRFKAICSSQKDLLFSIGAPASLPLYVSSKEVEIVSYKTSRVFDKLAVWTEDLIRRSRQATAIDLQSYVRGWLARKRLPQIKQKHKERIGKKLASWIKKMYIRKKTRRNNCAALKIQRWYTQSMIRIRFWINLRVSMNHYRNSALKLQRSLRAYICRLHTFRAIERYTATPSKYMNAPLCVECLDEDKEVYQVANLKCRDCDDLFCTSCFFKLHKTGKRLKHLVDLIDFKALHENSRIMCFVCEVEKATRICLSCACISGGFGSDASKIDQLRKTLRTPAPLPSNQVAEIKPKRLSLWSNRFSRKSVAFATDTGSKLSTASTKPSDIIPVENIAAACLCATCHDKKHIIRVERHVTLKKYTPYVKPPRRYIDQPIHKDTHQWMRMTDIYASGTIVISSLLAILGGKQVVEKRRYVTLLKVYAKKSDGNARKLKEYQRAAAISAFRDENESVIREAFDRYDQDKSGWIDRDELQCMFREELCQPLTEEELLKVLEAIDKSKNGHIEFEELLLWFSEELYNKSQNPNQAEPRKIQLLKETLRAKRQMRRYKERLEHQIDKLPSVPSPMVLLPTFPPKPKLVPGFPSVLQLETKDFETKKKVFFRFLHEICGIEWIFEDESLFSKEKAIETFEKVFLPRWNTGVLTYDFYFDDESFEHDGSKWTRKWIPKQKRYVYCSRRKKMIVKTQNKSSKKKRLMRREKSSSSLVSKIEDTVEEIEVEEDIEELIDPRRKEMLKQEARKAFDLADVDHSGFIDKDEFYNALRVELCEPISRQKALQVMDILDTNKSGTIDFDEFFQWFASEKCQDYQITSNVKRARAILKTRKTLRQTLKMIVTCILQGGKVINELITEKIKEERFKIDAKNASPQLIELLVEGFRKDLSMKALKLYQDNVQVAKEWLQDKIDEEEKKLEEKREMIRQMREIRRQKAKKRQEKLEQIYDKIKSSLVRKNKHLIQRERLQDILNNLDLEIQQVEEDMFKHRSQK